MDFDEYFNNQLREGSKFTNFVIYYSDAGGFVNKKKIDLNPQKCDDATIRYTYEGWGLVHFQTELVDEKYLKCRFSVNTPKRADAWKTISSHLESPDKWDWKIVEKHARRLIRILRKWA